MAQIIFEISDEARAKIEQAFQVRRGQTPEEAIIEFVEENVFEFERENAVKAAEASIFVNRDLMRVKR